MRLYDSCYGRVTQFPTGTVEDFEKGLPIEELRSKFMEGVHKGDPDRMVVWAGTGVGLMNTIQPAKVSDYCVLSRTIHLKANNFPARKL